MITLTYENISGNKVRAVISTEDKGYLVIVWVGESSMKDLGKLKRSAAKALKILQGEVV